MQAPASVQTKTNKRIFRFPSRPLARCLFCSHSSSSLPAHLANLLLLVGLLPTNRPTAKQHPMDSLLRNKHFRFGVPFLIAVVGGSFVLQYYSQLRYDIHQERHIMTKTKAIQDLVKPKPVSLEEEYEEYKKTVDLNNWTNIRGPRPWEGNEDFKEVIERRAEQSKNKWVFK